LELTSEINGETRATIRRIEWKLLRIAYDIGGFPVSPLLHIAEPGRGFHTGATFPMRSHPTTLESDTLGRPFGWKRIHAVDASVLPSIPATTITLSVMANAHRIGWQSLDVP
jgi:hypothetical protein